MIMNKKTPSENTIRRGVWLASASPVIAELAAASGLNWALLDMEHGYLTESGVLPNLMAFKASATLAVVRVPSHEPSLIGRILDRGADGIMVPHVNSAEEARSLVQAMRHPPHGIRGFARSTRACGYGLLSEPGNASPLLFAQIESVTAVSQVEAIAAVDGVDVLFIGPSDLRHDIQSRTDSINLTYESAQDRILQAALDHGKHAGIFLRNANDAENLAKKGFSFIAVDSDLGILRTAFSRSG